MSMRLSFIVLVFFGLAGHLVFQVFEISIAAFQIAGGILLGAVALQMLNLIDQRSPKEQTKRHSSSTIGASFNHWILKYHRCYSLNI